MRVGVSVTGWAGPMTVDDHQPIGAANGCRRGRSSLATGARERPRAARLVPGARGSGVYTTGQLQQAVYLEKQRIGRRAVIVGAEHVSFSAAVTLHHAGVEVVAMTTELDRQQSYLAFRAGAAVRYRFPVLTGTAVTEVLGRRPGRGRRAAASRRDPRGRALRHRRLHRRLDRRPRAGPCGRPRDGAGSTGPAVDTSLRTSVLGVYAVGNLLHPVVTADVAALDGRHVAAAVLDDLASVSPWTGGAGVAVQVRAPLRWVAPNRVVDPTLRPARGRFVLWADEFVAPARVEVRQGERVLARTLSPRPLVPEPAVRDRRGLAAQGRPRRRARRRPSARPRSPGVVLGCRLVAGEDLVELGEGLVVELDLERAQRPVELLDRARADDRGGDGGPGQQPGQADVGGLLAELVAQVLVGLDLRAVLLEGVLGAALEAPMACRAPCGGRRRAGRRAAGTTG